MTTAPHDVGDQYAYAITILNTGGNSDSSTLTVNLPAQTSYNGAIIDRGPGCSASGQTVTCPLDFFNFGLQTTVTIGAKVNALGTLVMSTAINSSPGEANPSDGVVTVSLNLTGSSPAPPAAFTPPTVPGKPQQTIQAVKFATLAFSKPKTIHLSVAHPSLGLAVKASGAATFTIELVNSKGKKLAGWTKHVRAGTTSYSLRLPPGARHAGHDLVVIKETGNPARATRAVDLTA